jgi:hypothetical protein
MGTDGDAKEQLAERLVRLVAIVLFIKVAGFLVLAATASLGDGLPARILVVTLVLAAAMAVVAVGLLQSRRWAWPAALFVLIADVVIIGGLLRLAIDVGIAMVLFQPPVRARFGLRTSRGGR